MHLLMCLLFTKKERMNDCDWLMPEITITKLYNTDTLILLFCGIFCLHNPEFLVGQNCTNNQYFVFEHI